MYSVQTRSGNERADRRDAEGRTGAPLARHLVTVDAGDDRRCFAGNVQEHRRGRAAEHRAVEDRGEHHHAGHRREGERDRQQQRHGGERADAGQHADERADEASEQAEVEVLRRQDDAEPGRQARQRVHSLPAPRSARQRHAEDVAEQPAHDDD
jgi:hypothetical protein